MQRDTSPFCVVIEGRRQNTRWTITTPATTDPSRRTALVPTRVSAVMRQTQCLAGGSATVHGRRCCVRLCDGWEFPSAISLTESMFGLASTSAVVVRFGVRGGASAMPELVPVGELSYSCGSVFFPFEPLASDYELIVELEVYTMPIEQGKEVARRPDIKSRLKSGEISIDQLKAQLCEPFLKVNFFASMTARLDCLYQLPLEDLRKLTEVLEFYRVKIEHMCETSQQATLTDRVDGLWACLLTGISHQIAQISRDFANALKSNDLIIGPVNPDPVKRINQARTILTLLQSKVEAYFQLAFKEHPELKYHPYPYVWTGMAKQHADVIVGLVQAQLLDRTLNCGFVE
ncbi:hypothetical protein Pelo_12549 [Pelomyxa schiedti]|nr:hypothetical protein Pelo_12549 [Pelomyxa schiedti]